MAGRFFRLTEEESRLAVCGLRTLHKVVRFSFRLFLVYQLKDLTFFGQFLSHLGQGFGWIGG